MNILLIRPRPHRDTIGLQSIMICEPLELEYLAAAVKGKHHVELVDMILEKKPLAHFVRQANPRVVGITGYISHVNVVKEYARTIKEISRDICVIVGGVHAEVVPEDFIDPSIDFIMTGDSLSSFPVLMEQLEKGMAGKPTVIFSSGEVKGLIKGRSAPDLLPDRKLSQKYRHRYYYVFHNPCALIKTSYGCPFACNFCFCRQITGGRYYERELDRVIEEIKLISEPEIYIVDDNFLVNPERVETFCRLLELHGIRKRYLIYGRADFIAGHEDIIARFAEVGLRAVIVGVESPSPGELEQYNKNSSVEINEKAIRVLSRHNIDCYATLILGIDWGDQDFERLYLWLKKQKLRFINLQPLTPLPGTPLFEQYKNSLIIPRRRHEQWDLANLAVLPGKISVRRYYYNILKLYFKITLNFNSLSRNLKYGIIPNLKLSMGVARIAWQYIKKMLRG